MRGSDEHEGRTPEIKPLTPGKLLKRVAMPGWRELHVRRIQLRNISARRFAACAVDEWRGIPTAIPAAAAVPIVVSNEPTRPRLLGGRAARQQARAMRLAQQEAQRLAARAQAAATHRRNAPVLDDHEMKILRSMVDTTEGKLAYATTVLAAEIEQSPAWNDEQFINFHARVDLFNQVSDIVGSVRDLLRSKDALGPRPSGALADDEEVMRIYRRRNQQHEERLAAITLRVQALLQYRDHVRECEPVLEKRKWIEAHSTSDDNILYVQAASDELAGAELTRAADEVETRTRAALAFLLDDVRRLSAMSS